ncbi:hypothetical protein DZD18_03545 [Rhodobacteraceae bacterium W635]|uniref:hypothetical protein n=1 Tax=Nioella halotolerans TaxID=2303578 RepID=UPI000E3CE7FF|nr:hypothetical protein DZD18_03545 [Rhodobacteraceae bacterium W635]
MKDASDPKALIFEAYRIEGISDGECRSIFMDWALSLPDPEPLPHIAALLARYAANNPDHPMTAVLREAEAAPPKAARRGGRAARIGQG